MTKFDCEATCYDECMAIDTLVCRDPDRECPYQRLDPEARAKWYREPYPAPEPDALGD